MKNDLIKLYQSFEFASNKERARQMESYLKNNFLFFGVMAQERKLLIKQFISELSREITFGEKILLVKAMWEHPKREMQLGAIDWMLSWKINEYTPEMIDFLEYLIITKSWWDTIDSLASNMVGRYARVFPEAFKIKAISWKNSSNFWLNRTCLIYQLKYREKTDLDWLSSCITEFKINKEFFVQKAIGWSLRELSKVNPEWVKNQVEKQNLVGLSKREALRLLEGK